MVSSLTAFVVLCGGAAFAADQLAKNSVGKKQLKANAVTTAKIKKNAVTTAKIKSGAVDGDEGQRGLARAPPTSTSGEPAVPDASSTKLRGAGAGRRSRRRSDSASRSTRRPTPRPPGENDFYYGAPSTSPSSRPANSPARPTRSVLRADVAEPDTRLNSRSGNSVAALGIYQRRDGQGRRPYRFNLGPSETGGARLSSPTPPRPHPLSMVVEATCKSGSGVAASERRRRRDRGQVIRAGHARNSKAPHLRERGRDDRRLRRSLRRRGLRRRPARQEQRRQETAQGQRGDHGEDQEKCRHRGEDQDERGGRLQGEGRRRSAPPTSRSAACRTPASSRSCELRWTSQSAPNRHSRRCHSAYTQEAGRTDTYVGAVDVAFDPGCVDRFAIAYLLMEPLPSTKFEISADPPRGGVRDTSTKTAIRRRRGGSTWAPTPAAA